MLSVSEIKSICAQYGIVPAKSRGQNFLIDQNIVDKIISAADLKKTDTILEVGPGLAVLTNELAQKAKKVYALELDKRIVEFLRAEFAQKENLEIIEGDILKFKINDLGLKDFGYKIVSNLPYSITSHFLKIFLGPPRPRPSEIIVMVQKEVGERLLARPGRMSLLSVMVQFYSEPEILSSTFQNTPHDRARMKWKYEFLSPRHNIRTGKVLDLFKISKNSFWPAPKVDSVVVKLKLKENLP
ncbi:16S rRNA (adenine(1518)-N(6)/adenine(1519)-N(6))-dimethyltransferase, partial [Candidatus Falkowbacteria bacterium]|nr:16S rRNA (adenine(1518)-N(6)/adenine(1519)-N(6))-dimethyltransferase [Candidatus Falkowbacteria bacterium]